MIRQSLDTDSVYADVALHGSGLTSLQFRDEKVRSRARCNRTVGSTQARALTSAATTSTCLSRHE